METTTNAAARLVRTLPSAAMFLTKGTLARRIEWLPGSSSWNHAADTIHAARGPTRSLNSFEAFAETPVFVLLGSAGVGALAVVLALCAMCACVSCWRRRRVGRERKLPDNPDAEPWTSSPLHEPVREDIRNRLLDECTPRGSPTSPGAFFIAPNRFSNQGRGFPHGWSLSREGVASLMLRAVELLREPSSPAYARMDSSERHRSPLAFETVEDQEAIPLESMSSRSVAVQALRDEAQNSTVDLAPGAAFSPHEVSGTASGGGTAANDSDCASAARDTLECLDSATEALRDGEALQRQTEDGSSTPRFVFQATGVAKASATTAPDVNSGDAPDRKDSDKLEVQSILDSLIANALLDTLPILEQPAEVGANKQDCEGGASSSMPGTSTTVTPLDREKSPEVVLWDGAGSDACTVRRINSAFDNPFYDQNMTPSPKLPRSVIALTPAVPAGDRGAMFGPGEAEKLEGSETRSTERWESVQVVDDSPLDMPVVVEEFTWTPDDIENESNVNESESGLLHGDEIPAMTLGASQSSDPIYVESIDEIISPPKRKSPGSTAISTQMYGELESDGERSVNQAAHLGTPREFAPPKSTGAFLSPIPLNERWHSLKYGHPGSSQKQPLPDVLLPTNPSPSLGEKPKKSDDILRLNANDSDDGLPLQFGQLHDVGTGGSSLLFPISPQSSGTNGEDAVLKDSPEKNRDWRGAGQSRSGVTKGASRVLDFDQSMHPIKENVQPGIASGDLTGFDTDSSSSSLGDFKKFLGKKDEIVPNVLRGYIFPLDSPQVSSTTSSVHRAANTRESRPRRKTSPAPRKNSNPRRRPMSPGYATQAPQIDLSNHPFGRKHAIPDIARERNATSYDLQPNALDGWLAGKPESTKEDTDRGVKRGRR